MRSAAQRQEDDPGPEPDVAAVVAKADRVLDVMLGTAGRITDTLAAWDSACPQDSKAVPVLQGLNTEVIGDGLHCEEMRQELARVNASLAILKAAYAAAYAEGFAAGSTSERVTQPAPGRHAAERGSRRLKAVRDLPVAAFAGAAVALRHAWAAHPVAAPLVAATTVATFAAGAVVAPHAAATFGGGSPSAPAPAASVYSAVPVTGPPVATFVTKPKDGKSGTLSLNMPPSLPSYVPQGAYPPPGGGSGQDPGQPSSLPVSVPDVKLVVTGALDLGTGQSGVIRLAAYGGTVSWSASSSVAGLTLDSSSGSLPAGDAATVTVSIGADLQALTGPGSVTITYGNGKTATVPVSWTIVPLPVPTVVPTDVLPSALPTIAGV